MRTKADKGRGIEKQVFLPTSLIDDAKENPVSQNISY